MRSCFAGALWVRERYSTGTMFTGLTRMRTAGLTVLSLRVLWRASGRSLCLCLRMRYQLRCARVSSPRQSRSILTTNSVDVWGDKNGNQSTWTRELGESNSTAKGGYCRARGLRSDLDFREHRRNQDLQTGCKTNRSFSRTSARVG